MKQAFRFILLLSLLVPAAASAQHAKEFRLQFKEGQIRHVGISETLRLMMHFPQVEADLAQPSIRKSDYAFTETVEKVHPDGSADIAAVLDSFVTIINIGEGKNGQEFFRFNSADVHDIKQNFHDIKTLPRGQFLGQTLRFVMNSDGTIHNFQNLQSFHDAAVGKGYDYDMVHAILSLSDSLRIGQLVELGAGALAAAEHEFTSPSTATEIPITRKITAHEARSGKLEFRERYLDPPTNIDYLEGIATPMSIGSFYGAGVGEITMKDHFLSHSEYRDTANVLLHIDIDTVPEEITRIVVTDVHPVAVMHGGVVSIKETEMHRAVPKDPLKEAQKDAVIIDPVTGKVTETGKTGDAEKTGDAGNAGNSGKPGEHRKSEK